MSEGRLSQINQTMQAISTGWPFLLVELESMIAEKTESLIAQNNDEVRGAIKALQAVMNLPETLQQEREGFTAALSDEDAAHN